MRSTHKFGIAMWLMAAFVIIAMLVYARQTWLQNGDPAILSGYLLIGLMLLLGFFNWRKRLSMVPVIRAAHWTVAHSIGGVLAIGLFWIHIGAAWPNGATEQLLATLFYLVSASGVIGYVLQKIYPRRLTQSGVEVTFEKIPLELAEIRSRVEAIVLECTSLTGSDTLARHYLETMGWFFRRPRFVLSHAFGGQGGYAWIRREMYAVGRHVDDQEQEQLSKIADLAVLKNRIDFHFAVQGLMKLWLFAHIPLAAALIVLAIWHALLVHVYLL